MSGGDLPEFHDDRTPDAQRYDAICDQVIDANRRVLEMADLVKQFIEHSHKGQTTTVIHKQQGMGAWGAAAVVACFFTAVIVVILAIVFVPEVHDLKAWQDILRRDVARLQAAQPERK